MTRWLLRRWLKRRQIHNIERPPSCNIRANSLLRRTDNMQAKDPRAHRRHMMKKTSYKRSIDSYEIRRLYRVDMDPKHKVSLAALLGSVEAVMLNFIFTTYATICPVLSATFLTYNGNRLTKQKMYGWYRPSIPSRILRSNPINTPIDSPEQGWQFLTDDLADIVASQKSFDACRGEKMSHEPLTFLRYRRGDPSIRLEGFTSASEVIAGRRKLLSQQRQSVVRECPDSVKKR